MYKMKCGKTPIGLGSMKCEVCSNGTTGLQIDNILKVKCNKYGGVFMKDELDNEKLRNGYWYVINMESSTDGNGTHWCAYKHNPSIWFDSFGIVPPLEVLSESRKYGMIYNKDQIQNEHSTCCGWFSIACVLYDEPILKPSVSLDRFTHRFSKNTLLNDTILAQLLNAKGVKTDFYPLNV